MYFRPVLCEAPPYEPAESGQSAQVSLSCSGASALTAQNLNIQPFSTPPSGFTTDLSRIPPDAALGGTPSTNPSHERTSATVLVPWAPGSHAGAVRYVLGPAQLTTASIKLASAKNIGGDLWVVNYTMTTAGSALMDKVAFENFHQQIAVELGGNVYSTPLVEPTQTSFTSYQGKGQISGLTKSQAALLSSAMSSEKTRP